MKIILPYGEIFPQLEVLVENKILRRFDAYLHDVNYIVNYNRVSSFRVREIFYLLLKNLKKYIVTSIMLVAVSRELKRQAFLYNCKIIVP